MNVQVRRMTLDAARYMRTSQDKIIRGRQPRGVLGRQVVMNLLVCVYGYKPSQVAKWFMVDVSTVRRSMHTCTAKVLGRWVMHTALYNYLKERGDAGAYR